VCAWQAVCGEQPQQSGIQLTRAYAAQEQCGSQQVLLLLGAAMQQLL
jgi:hypothetical protein